jgi:hypothetical protein
MSEKESGSSETSERGGPTKDDETEKPLTGPGPGYPAGETLPPESPPAGPGSASQGNSPEESA